MEMKQKGTGSERRQYIRLPTTTILKCSAFGGHDFGIDEAIKKSNAVVKNLSAGGVLFESTTSFTVGKLLRLEISVPGWERFKKEFYKEYETSHSQPVVVLATVVRVEMVDPKGIYDIGACFSAIDTGHQWAMMKYINRELAS